MKKQNNFETELNKIRTDFYVITKDMSSSERVAYLKAQVAPIHHKFGIRPVRQATPNTQRQVI
jgi:hypothetical protein